LGTAARLTRRLIVSRMFDLSTHTSSASTARTRLGHDSFCTVSSKFFNSSNLLNVFDHTESRYGDHRIS
jgi:hypothetical protein